MKYRLGINGFGRIGRNVARINQLRGYFDLVAINDINPDIGNLAYLFKYDSTLGKYKGRVEPGNKLIRIDDREIMVFNQAEISKALWAEAGVDVIIDCTGVSQNVVSGADLVKKRIIRKMVVTHASPHVDKTIIMGVNEASYIPERHHVLSSSICDANAIGPVVSFLDRRYGIDSGFVTTLHPWLSYQKLVDAPLQSQANPGHFWNDYRLGRASAGALIPKETTAVSALFAVAPELEGRLDAVSYRVPTHVVSSADLTLHLTKPITTKELLAALTELASSCRYVELNHEPLVSVDFEQTDASCHIDMQFARVVGSSMVKVIVWYDNEWGYSNRALDIAVLAVS